MKQYIFVIFSFLFIFFGPIQTLAQEQKAITTFYLTRHAEKASDGTKDPPLNELGEKRAENLANILKEVEFAGIYATPYKRTMQTAMPLAKQQNIAIISYKPFDNKVFDGLAGQVPGANYLITGHSNTIPALVNALIGAETFKQLNENQYNKLFVVSIVPGAAPKVQVLNY